MDSNSQPTKRKDLRRVAEAYLADRLTLTQFRRNFALVWANLSRMALSEAETQEWAEIVSLVEHLDNDLLHNAATPPPCDDQVLRELLVSVLGSDARAKPSDRVRRARQIQQDIAVVLLRDWDPIGVNDVPEAADEYDSYVGGIYRLLASGTTADALAGHLRNIEVNQMGLLRSSVEALVPTAEKLLAIDITLRESSV